MPVSAPYLDLTLTLRPPGGVSWVLLLTFIGMGALGLIYALPVRNRRMYMVMGAHAVGGVLVLLAEDLITLLAGWEVLTFTAFFLIVGRLRPSRAAGKSAPGTGKSGGAAGGSGGAADGAGTGTGKSAAAAGASSQGGASGLGSVSSRGIEVRPAALGPQPGAPRAGVEYLAFQITAAAALFLGILIQYSQTGSLLVQTAHPAAQPVLLFAIAIKTGAMPLHFWLVDSYPKAPFAAAALLSVYSTKVGVYTAARLLSLPVTPYLGAFMALAGVAGALRQRDARRLLSFHIISQVGYMIAGVGLATELGIAAGLFHAVNHIIYKALLFMVAGAVIYRTGRTALTHLGGLYRDMPLTFLTGIVASAAIAGVPPMSGFASKELIKVAAGYGPVTTMLAIATMGTGLSFIKFMYAMFVQQPRRPYPARAKEAPAAMLIPMVLLAVFSIVNGVLPSLVVPQFDHAYYTGTSLRAGLWPLAGSVLLWAVFGRRLLAETVPPHRAGRWRLRVRNMAGRLRLAIAQSHTIRPQAYLPLVFGFWLVVLLLL